MFVEIPQTFMIMWLLWVIHNGKYNVLLKTTLNKILISFYFNSNSSFFPNQGDSKHTWRYYFVCFYILLEIKSVTNMYDIN